MRRESTLPCYGSSISKPSSVSSAVITLYLAWNGSLPTFQSKRLTAIEGMIMMDAESNENGNFHCYL